MIYLKILVVQRTGVNNRMRDPKRIDKFCETLKVYWHMVPDWRFMQLVCNLQAQIGSDGFYLEDDQAMELIEQMLKGE